MYVDKDLWSAVLLPLASCSRTTASLERLVNCVACAHNRGTLVLVHVLTTPTTSCVEIQIAYHVSL
jgi:hypothetical protein